MTEQNSYISMPVDEGLLLARRTDDRLFLFNGSARFMWEQLAAGVDESEIPARVSSNYGIAITQSRKDFQTTLRRWRRERLLPRGGMLQCYELAGLAFNVRFHDAGIADHIRPILAHLSAGPELQSQHQALLEFDFESRDSRVVVTANGIQLIRTDSVGKAIEKLILYLFHYVRDHLDWKVSVHAAAVATTQGCLLLPGSSGSGKSSLTAALLAHDDVEYVADDMALLTGPSLDVVPVAMPLVLKSGSWQALESLLPGLAEKATYSRLGKDSRYWAPPCERIADKPRAVQAIVFPRYAETSGIEMVAISPLETMGRLTAAPCALRPPITATALGEIASFAHRVPGYVLTYGALDAACSAVLDLQKR
jgi:hypothetical protein